MSAVSYPVYIGKDDSTYLRTESVNGDAAYDCERNKDHVVPPADFRKRNGGRFKEGYGREHENGDAPCHSFGADMSWENLRAVHVQRGITEAGESNLSALYSPSLSC